jgi:Domain of unknown function (DUF1906)
VRNSVFVVVLGALLGAAPQPTSAQEPADHVIAEAKTMAIARTGPSCGPHPELKAADFSIPLTEIRTYKGGPLAFDVLKSFGVRTIFRYYDLPIESLDCKTLLSDELDLILTSGFSVAIVFQHHGNEPLTFLDPGRAQLAAKRSLEPAEAHGQPYLTAIYFGVDGAENEIVAYANEFEISKGEPLTAARQRQLVGENFRKMSRQALDRYILNYEFFRMNHALLFPGREPTKVSPADMLPHIDTYFAAIRAEFDRASGRDPAKSYKLGVYGSGLVNLHMKNNPAVSYFWLAQSSGWKQFSRFLDSKLWNLWQQYPTKCTPPWYNVRTNKTNVDFDLNMPMSDEFGQWSTRRAGPKPLPRPETCKTLSLRKAEIGRRRGIFALHALVSPSIGDAGGVAAT